MPPQKRRFEPCEIDRLFAEPFRFQFAQAMRLLELWLCRSGSADQRTLLRVVRFRNSTSLTFPASELEALQVGNGNHPATPEALLAAMRAGQDGPIWITPAFIGLLGCSGALPLHYTESVVTQIGATNSDAPRAFFDMMSSRTVALFHRAYWAYRVHQRRLPDGGDARPLPAYARYIKLLPGCHGFARRPGMAN